MFLLMVELFELVVKRLLVLRSKVQYSKLKVKSMGFKAINS